MSACLLHNLAAPDEVAIPLVALLMTYVMPLTVPGHVMVHRSRPGLK